MEFLQRGRMKYLLLFISFNLLVGSLFFILRKSPENSVLFSEYEEDSSFKFSQSGIEEFDPPDWSYVTVASRFDGMNLNYVLNLAGSVNRHTSEIDMVTGTNVPTIRIFANPGSLSGKSSVLRLIDNLYIVDSVYIPKTSCFRNPACIRRAILDHACEWSNVSLYIDPHYKFSAEMSKLPSLEEKGRFVTVMNGDEPAMVALFCNVEGDSTHKLDISEVSFVKEVNLSTSPGYFSDIGFLRGDVTLNIIDLMAFNLPQKEYPVKENETTLALMVPSTTRRLDLKNGVNDLPIFNELLPSFMKNMDIPQFRIVVYICYDDSDVFYVNEKNRKLVKEKANALISAKTDKFDIRFIESHGYEHNPVWHWNLLSQIAYFAGVDYLYQVNDDTRIITSMYCTLNLKIWINNDYPPPKEGTKQLIDKLKDSPVGRDVGVAAPLDEWKSRILFIFSMISRRHIEIFGNLYPPLFHNWYSDDWMTNIYEEKASFLVDTNRVANIKIDRYDKSPLSTLPKEKLSNFLTQEVRSSCERVNYYLEREGESGRLDCNLKWPVTWRPIKKK